MGITVNVYRWGMHGDCTLHGISEKANALVVVNVDGPWNDPEDIAKLGYPVAWLEKSEHGVIRLVPAKRVDGEWCRVDAWWMNGGNFAFTSDSRYTEALRALGGDGHSATPIFDRKEW